MMYRECSENRGPGSVVCIVTGYGLDGPGIEARWEARFSVPVQTGPRAHPISCKMGTGFFPGVNSGWGETLAPHSLLVPLLPLWAIRPAQSLSACTRMHFTLPLTYSENHMEHKNTLWTKC